MLETSEGQRHYNDELGMQTYVNRNNLSIYKQSLQSSRTLNKTIAASELAQESNK